jgi:hypothetical protein
MNATDSEDYNIILQDHYDSEDPNANGAATVELLPSQPSRSLNVADELVFPLSKSAVVQYSENEYSQTELRIFYANQEICFDDPEQFAFGEALAKQSRFTAGDAIGWGAGKWPKVKEMLEDLIEHGILRYAEEDLEAALAIDREDQASPLPPAEIDEPQTWYGFEDVMRTLTGKPLEIGYLELVVPIFRVAHMYMDADGRQIGEANVFPPALRLDRPTQWRTCTYPGTRYQLNRPMNVTALKVMRVHWRQIMAVLLKVREAYLKRFPDARNGWTVGDLERVSVAVLALPSYMLLRQDNPVENGKLHPVLSSIFRVTDGLRMTMHQMLFVPFGEPTRRPDTPMTANEVFAYAERNHSLHSGHAVCAGPQFMIEEFLAVLLDGAEPKSGMPRTLDPDVEAALDSLEPAIDYGMRGLQAFATIFSLWPGMTEAYHDLFQTLDGWTDERSPIFDDLHARFKAHFDYLTNDTYLANEEWRANRLMVYGEMYAKCTFGLTGAYPERSLEQKLAECDIGADDPLNAQITTAFTRYLSDMQAPNALASQLSKTIVGFMRRSQATVRLAEAIQLDTNKLLSRSNPTQPFSASDIDLHNKMQNIGDQILPYLIDEISSILDINISINSNLVSIN